MVDGTYDGVVQHLVVAVSPSLVCQRIVAVEVFVIVKAVEIEYTLAAGRNKLILMELEKTLHYILQVGLTVGLEGLPLHDTPDGIAHLYVAVDDGGHIGNNR